MEGRRLNGCAASHRVEGDWSGPDTLSARRLGQGTCNNATASATASYVCGVAWNLVKKGNLEIRQERDGCPDPVAQERIADVADPAPKQIERKPV